MGRISVWTGRHRGLVAFGAGVVLVLVAVAAVAYFVLLDQRRSARALAAALTQALGRTVEIERVPALSPSRVVMRGVRLPGGKDWPAEIAAEEVDASGPLLSAARGDSAPVRVVVTRPTVTPAPGPAVGAGASAVESLRQGLAALLGSAAQLDLSLAGGELRLAGSDPARFDVTVRKGSADTRGELVLHGRAGPPLSVAIEARSAGDQINLTIDGQGPLGPAAPWLPAGVLQAAGATSARLQLVLVLDPGDRLTGQGSLRLGDLAALDLDVGMREGLLSVTRARGGLDLGFGWAAASLPGRPRGRAELTDGEITWKPGGSDGPRARGTLQVADARLPAEVAGTEVRLVGVEVRPLVEATPDGLVVQGPLHAGRIEARGIDVGPLETQARVAAGPGGGVRRVELTALTGRLMGAPVSGQLAYDGARGRADGRLDAESLPLADLARRLQPGWLADTDRLRTGPARITLSDVDVRGLADGRVEASAQALALTRADGQVEVPALRVQGTLRADGIAARLEAERVRSTLPSLDGLLPRVEGTADLVRRGEGIDVARASITARDGEAREMLAGQLARRAGGGVTVTARVPALERLGSLWPSMPRKVVGQATVTLDAADATLAAFDGQVVLRVPEAELLGGKLSARDLSAEVPIRRGAGGPVGLRPPGPIEVGELIAYGVVVHDVAGRARAVDQRLALVDLGYSIYSGQGTGGGEVALGPDGVDASLVLSGQGARIEEFIASYGIRGGTMTGLLRYDLNMRYRAGRLAADGRMLVPEGGTVTIELLDRLFQYTAADPSGVAKRALSSLRAFDYKSADATVRTGPTDLHVSLSLRGRERFGIFPPPVKEINVRDMPLGFLARQFPGL